LDFEREMARLPNVGRLNDSEDIWLWSPAPGIDFGCMVSSDRGHVFQVTSRNSLDTGVFRTVLHAAFGHGADLVASRSPLTVIRGVSFSKSDFDTAVASLPSPKRRFLPQGTGFDHVTIPVFPAFNFEFSGDETQEEADLRVGRRIKTGSLKREPSPFVRLRFDNPRTGAGTKGSTRIISTEPVLLSEIANLDGTPGGYVELENWAGSKMMVEWLDGYLVSQGVAMETLGLDRLLTCARDFLRMSM